MRVSSMAHLVHMIELYRRPLAVLIAHRNTFLQDMCCETVDSALGKLLATSFACMFVSITRVVQLGTPFEVLQDQC